MRKRFLALFLALLVSLSPAQAFAEIDLGLKDISGAWYSDEADCSEYNTELGSFDGITTAGLSKLQSEFVDKYHDIAAKLGQQYKIPWETVIAQGIIESASGTSYFALHRNNFFGIGAFDSNPNAARSYSSAESGWKGYFENIKNTPTYRNHGVFSGKTITDPYEYLKAIKAAGYATDPNYVEKVGSIVKAIEKRSQEKGWEPSSKINSDGASILSSYSSSDICLSNNLNSGNMNINKTAINFAWPADSGDHNCDDTKDEYKKALLETKAVRSFGNCKCNNSPGCRWKHYGTSCSVYVGTVLRYSGIAPDAALSPGGLVKYMKAHPETFTEVTEGYNKNNMQAGDIQAFGRPGDDGNGHARLVIKGDDGKFHIAEAHLYQDGGKPPKIVKKEYDGNAKGYHVFRAKNNQQSSAVNSESSNLLSKGPENISKTALKLAWPKGTDYTNKPKPEYSKALVAVKILTDKTINESNNKCSSIGANSDRFVSTVLRYSGVDPKAGELLCNEDDTNENCIIRRALAQPDIYEEVTDGYNDDKAQDGDIFISSKHTWVIAKYPDDGKLYRVEASNKKCYAGKVTKQYKYSPTEDGQKVRIFRIKDNNTVECQCQSQDASQSNNGDINKTAIDLAWPTYRQHSLYDPKPAYKKALAAVGLNHYGEKWVDIGASCDAFVATVMRYSGVDPDFPCCGAGNQLSYLSSHPEKYKRIPNTGGTSNLQPGDIRSHSGHIEIVIKREDGSFGIAAASHADRTADINSFYSDSRFQIFRRIK